MISESGIYLSLNTQVIGQAEDQSFVRRCGQRFTKSARRRRNRGVVVLTSIRHPVIFARPALPAFDFFNYGYDRFLFFIHIIVRLGSRFELRQGNSSKWPWEARLNQT
jgi:hypothetical protein